MRHLVRIGLVLAVALAVIALSACSVSFGGSDQIDHKKAETLLRDNLHPNSGSPKLTSISCPSGVKIKKGGTFDCTVSFADGSTSTVTIHMTDSSGRISFNSSDIHNG